MATYEVRTAKSSQDFKYRSYSKDGHPLADVEYQRLKKAGEKPQLYRWERGEATLVSDGK